MVSASNKIVGLAGIALLALIVYGIVKIAMRGSKSPQPATCLATTRAQNPQEEVNQQPHQKGKDASPATVLA